MNKTITQDNITYKYCYVKTRGTSWAYGYYPETQLIEAKAKKKKPTANEQLADKCIKMWSKIIHEKFNETCQMCGKKDGTMNAHHILTKGAFPSFKYDLDNGILLCYHCHKISGNSPHTNPERFAKWFRTEFPDWHTDIIVKRIEGQSKLNMKDVYEGLKIEYDKLRM